MTEELKQQKREKFQRYLDNLPAGAISCSHAIDLFAIKDVVYPANSPLVLAL